MKKLLKKAVRHPATKPLMATLMGHQLRLHPELAGMVPGGARLALDVDDDTAKMLSAIPSETSEAERLFLYKFFRCLWSGQGDVIEIGPFLGGTTRAIAMGMRANPRADGGKLRTYDRFASYYDVERLKSYTEPLVADGTLDPKVFDDVGDEVEFLEVFSAIHSQFDYWDVMQVESGGVPDRAGTKSDEHLELDGARSSDAIFIDGCKSWYGTKYFMQEVAKIARPGCHVLFQDYGWYTCFWLPVFVEAFADHFDLWSNVGPTYSFVLQKPLDAAEIDARFPDEPSDMGAARLSSLLDAQVEQAERRGDVFAAVRHTMHKAAALAYVDEFDAARRILTDLRGEDRARPHRAQIDAALKSPTYTPDGPIRLP